MTDLASPATLPLATLLGPPYVGLSYKVGPLATLPATLPGPLYDGGGPEGGGGIGIPNSGPRSSFSLYAGGSGGTPPAATITPL